MTDLYTYIAVRRDLPKAQQIIQATHAQQGIGSKGITNTVLLDIKTEDQLLMLAEGLKGRNIDHYVFWEPDIGEYTALATAPIRAEERGDLQSLKLYR